MRKGWRAPIERALRTRAQLAAPAAGILSCRRQLSALGGFRTVLWWFELKHGGVAHGGDPLVLALREISACGVRQACTLGSNGICGDLMGSFPLQVSSWFSLTRAVELGFLVLVAVDAHRLGRCRRRRGGRSSLCAVLRYLMLLSETRRSLPYGLWGLPDQYGPPGCLVWSVRHWETRVYRSSSLKFGRYLT